MQLIRYRPADDSGNRHAIASEPGRKYMPLVWIDVPLRLARIPNDDIARHSSDLAASPEAIRTAAQTMLNAGSRLGITQGAADHLRAALSAA